MSKGGKFARCSLCRTFNKRSLTKIACFENSNETSSGKAFYGRTRPESSLEKAVLSGFMPKGICLVYQSLRGAPLMKAFSVKDLQATIGINIKESGESG